MYKIFAMVQDDDGILVDANTPEFLGDAFVAVYEDKEDALEMALLLQSEVNEYDLPRSLVYRVEKWVG